MEHGRAESVSSPFRGPMTPPGLSRASCRGNDRCMIRLPTRSRPIRTVRPAPSHASAPRRAARGHRRTRQTPKVIRSVPSHPGMNGARRAASFVRDVRRNNRGTRPRPGMLAVRPGAVPRRRDARPSVRPVLPRESSGRYRIASSATSVRARPIGRALSCPPRCGRTLAARPLSCAWRGVARPAILAARRRRQNGPRRPRYRDASSCAVSGRRPAPAILAACPNIRPSRVQTRETMRRCAYV
jgi:hypothetical protein